MQRDFNPEIYELTPTTKLGDFPGYNNIMLSRKDLQVIVKMDAPKWRTALSMVKGAYCITDKSSGQLYGQLYIGSASGNEARIWQIWSAYADVCNRKSESPAVLR